MIKNKKKKKKNALRNRLQNTAVFFPNITNIISYGLRIIEKGFSIFLSQISWIKVLLIMVRRDMVEFSIDES